jgi:hypothetical protein
LVLRSRLRSKRIQPLEESYYQIQHSHNAVSG